MELSKVCAFGDWNDPELEKAMLEIYPPNAPKPHGYTCHLAPKNGKPVLHRKIWEWAIGILSLQKLGKIRPDAVALGIGSGFEFPSFWLTKHLRYVIATDLYQVGKWGEADPGMLINPELYCPYSFNRRRLGVQMMDGTNITFEDETFDIVYSYSSIEHFGGLQAACKTMREIYRVLKPGGVASIATELVIEGDSTKTDFFSRADISELVKASGMKLTNEIDFSVEDRRGIVKIPEEISKMPQIIIDMGGIKSTSIHMMLIKS